MAFNTTLGTTKFNIETVTGANVIIRNGVVKANGKPYEDIDPAAQFYVDVGLANASSQDELLRFRSVSQPTKYLAVSGSKVILKVIPSTLSITGSSHDFTEDPENDDFVKFSYRHSSVNSPQYMSVDSNDDVIIAGNSTKAWFRLVPTSTVSSANTTNSMPTDYFLEFEEYFEESSGDATRFIEVGAGSVSRKVFVNERMSISEE